MNIILENYFTSEDMALKFFEEYIKKLKVKEIEIVLSKWQQSMYDVFIKTNNIINNCETDFQNPKNRNYLSRNGYKNLIYSHNSESMRGLGRTYLCLYIANKFKWDVFVSTDFLVDYLKQICKTLQYENFKIYNTGRIIRGDIIRGSVLSDTIIFDNIQLNNNIIERIEEYYGIKNIIGFIRS